VIDAATVTLGVVILAGLIAVAVAFARERERRAALVALFLALGLSTPFLAAGLLEFPFDRELSVGLLLLAGMIPVALLVPTGRPATRRGATPRQRIDERDTMFSRRLLEPGSAAFDEYYERHPEKRAWDDRFRSRPGLLSEGASCYDAWAFAAADSSFKTIEKLRPHVDGRPAERRMPVEPSAMTRFILQWGRKLGAVHVGVTRLEDYHLYSTVGRGPDYGEPVTREHQFAIALTVEMDREMLERGPRGPTVMESAQQYVASGTIAVQIAQFIRNLGYPARAHIDGNYRVVCPLVARDAGLGEIGRLGLLITPDLGPRVRIAVVTTDLPLVPSRPARDETVLDFCAQCRKCARVCPPRAISFDGPTEIDGVHRWQINSELCYIYWCHTGTDCGRCVACCPYSHPDNLVHGLVRRGVRNSALFRRLAVLLDDAFFGRRPEPLPVQDWMRTST